MSGLVPLHQINLMQSNELLNAKIIQTAKRLWYVGGKSETQMLAESQI